jgi:hypothetical protein
VDTNNSHNRYPSHLGVDWGHDGSSGVIRLIRGFISAFPLCHEFGHVD